MQIDFFAELPVAAQRRHPRRYAAVLTAVQSTDGWVRIPLTDLPGATDRDKQGAINQAGRKSGCPVRTHICDGHIFVQRKAITGGAQ